MQQNTQDVSSKEDCKNDKINTDEKILKLHKIIDQIKIKLDENDKSITSHATIIS